MFRGTNAALWLLIAGLLFLCSVPCFAAYLWPVTAIAALDATAGPVVQAAASIQESTQQALGASPPLVSLDSLDLAVPGAGTYIVLWTATEAVPVQLPELGTWGVDDASLNGDGFIIRSLAKNGRTLLVVASPVPRGVVYGAQGLADRITAAGVPDDETTEVPSFRYRNGEAKFRGNLLLNNRVFPEYADSILISCRYYPEVFESPERMAQQLTGLADRQAAFSDKVQAVHDTGCRFFTFNYDFTLWNPIYNLEDKQHFFSMHPAARASGGPRAIWCPSDPATFGFAVSKYRELWETVPSLDGVVLSYDSAGFIDCDHCRPIYPWLNRMVDYVTQLNTVLKAINPDVTIVLRTWGLPVDMRALANALPPNVLFMTKWSVPPGNDFTWKGDISTNIGVVPRLFTENTYCETGSGMSHMHYAGRRMKQHYEQFASLGVWGVDAEEDVTSGVVDEVMTLGRGRAAWNPFTFDPSATLRDWAVKRFGSQAGQLVHDALINTDEITDALILEPNVVGSFQMYHFNPRQAGTYGVPLKPPADLAAVNSSAVYNSYRARFEIADAMVLAQQSYDLLKQASSVLPGNADLSKLVAAASATLNLAKTFRDYHLALLNYRMGKNLLAAGNSEGSVYLGRAVTQIRDAVTDTAFYKTQIQQITEYTQDYLNFIPQEVNNAYHGIVMQPLESKYPSQLWQIGTFDCDTAAREPKPLLSDEFGQAYVDRWAAYSGNSADCYPLTGSPQDFPPNVRSTGITSIRLHFDADLSSGALLKLSFVPGDGPVTLSDGTVEWAAGSVQFSIALNGRALGYLDEVSSRRPLGQNRDYCRYVELPPDQAASHVLTISMVGGTSAVFDALRLTTPGAGGYELPPVPPYESWLETFDSDYGGMSLTSGDGAACFLVPTEGQTLDCTFKRSTTRTDRRTRPLRRAYTDADSFSFSFDFRVTAVSQKGETGLVGLFSSGYNNGTNCFYLEFYGNGANSVVLRPRVQFADGISARSGYTYGYQMGTDAHGLVSYNTSTRTATMTISTPAGVPYVVANLALPAGSHFSLDQMGVANTCASASSGWQTMVVDNVAFGITPPLAVPADLAAAKRAAVGTRVRVEGLVVSEQVNTWTGTATIPLCFYAQSPGRTCGARIGWAQAISPGSTVDVSGVVRESDGERMLSADTVSLVSSGPGPMALGAAGAATIRGLSISGLLVRIWGRVTERSPSNRFESGHFYVDDGSGIRDGSGAAGIRCRLAPDPFGAPLPPPAVGSYVIVEGAVGATTASGRATAFLRTLSVTTLN